MSFWNCFRNKKVLLTGHTGFKGSWLSIWLKHLGAEVYGYALTPGSDMDNFITCGLSQHINQKIADIKDKKALTDYFLEVQPDFAFHLAAQPLVLLSYKDPVETFETNLMGVVNFFEAIRATPSIKVAINVTSDKCYDNKEWIWGYRENDPMGGKDPYSASKGCAELITSSYSQSFFNGQNTTLVASARAGNVIGGGDWAFDRIIPDFFRAAIKKDTLVVRNPYATRPWQHVLEPLSGYLTLAAMLFMKGNAFTGAWNFGPLDNTNYTVEKLLDSIISINPTWNYNISASPKQLHEASLLKLDISKAVNQLNWKPVLSFSETVDFTVKGYLDDMNNDDKILEKRITQIELYTNKAIEKSIEWAG